MQFILVLLFLVILVIPFSSCKKNSDKNTIVTPSDDIVFHDFFPDTSFTSVKLWEYTQMGTFPVPSDSAAGIFLKFDQDSIVGLFISTYYNFVSASNPEANYNYSADLYSARSTDSVAVETIYSPRANQFVKDSLIPGRSHFSTYGFMYGEGHTTFVTPAPVGDAYFGFKLFRNGGSHFGWVLLNINTESKTLTLKEYAVNRTPNRPIKAGQKN